MENRTWKGRKVEQGEGRDRKAEKGKEHERMMRVMEMLVSKKSYFHLL